MALTKDDRNSSDRHEPLTFSVNRPLRHRYVVKPGVNIRGVNKFLLEVITKASNYLGFNLQLSDGKRAHGTEYGAGNSKHLTGQAVDVSIRATPGRAQKIIQAINLNGQGVVRAEYHPAGYYGATADHIHVYTSLCAGCTLPGRQFADASRRAVQPETAPPAPHSGLVIKAAHRTPVAEPVRSASHTHPHPAITRVAHHSGSTRHNWRYARLNEEADMMNAGASRFSYAAYPGYAQNYVRPASYGAYGQPYAYQQQAYAPRAVAWPFVPARS
ncbi:MAG TPA: hypothetical protein VHB73_05760 [Alphaproteobacteria bacterium]|nr:hypothetical protein [Alphaproteobacteria bacterium]